MASRTATKVLEGVRAYLEDEDFLLEISCWAWEYCSKFPLEPPHKWEHPLEFTKLHNEYRGLFEGRADEFITEENVDLKAILDDVHSELENNPGPMRALVDSLAASEDYMAFCKFMQRVRQRRDWAEGNDLETAREVAEEKWADDMEPPPHRSPDRRRTSSLEKVEEVAEEEDGDVSSR
mmetsp:Transcript_73758/g.208220  ORF Transcript_73758/g.208220 Transcript_73758/m.208220 type:complete len:179 (-) Transcript_73758:23-559(-)